MYTVSEQREKRFLIGFPCMKSKGKYGKIVGKKERNGYDT